MSFSIENQTKLAEIEAHLGKHPYLSEGSLPGSVDARIYNSLLNVPDKNIYPNFYYWYILIKQFAPEALKSWELREQEPEKSEMTLNVSEPKRSMKKFKSSSRQKISIDIKLPANDFDVDEFAQKIQQLDFPGLEWLKQYKKLTATSSDDPHLRMFCLIDEEKINFFTDLIPAIEKVEKNVIVIPTDSDD